MSPRKKSVLNNVVRGWITSILGVAIIGGSSYMAITNQVPWQWHGLTGCGVGSVLLFTPDSIKAIIDAVIKKHTQQ